MKRLSRGAFGDFWCRWGRVDEKRRKQTRCSWSAAADTQRNAARSKWEQMWPGAGLVLWFDCCRSLLNKSEAVGSGFEAKEIDVRRLGGCILQEVHGREREGTAWGRPNPDRSTANLGALVRVSSTYKVDPQGKPQPGPLSSQARRSGRSAVRHRVGPQGEPQPQPISSHTMHRRAARSGVKHRLDPQTSVSG